MGLAAAEKHLAARFNKDDMKIVDHYTCVPEHASINLQPKPISLAHLSHSCPQSPQSAAFWVIEVCSDAQCSLVMLMSRPDFLLSALLISCIKYHPVCKGGGVASIGTSSWEMAATWRESPMRRLPWPVTGSLASSLPSTMTTSEPSPHPKLASTPLQYICACSTFH